MKTCADCGVSFQANRASRRYCSRACYAAARIKATPPLSDRFWARVNRGGPDECWLWTGRRDRKGYGRIHSNTAHSVPLIASRVSYEIAFGPIPSDHCVCHACDNPPCVNPAHLWVGTLADNLRDMSIKGRNWQQKKTHCPQGHEYSSENTRWTHGHRFCRTCSRAAVAAYKQRRAA